MIRIDTEFEDVIVEIEGKEYPVAPKTVEMAEKLIKIEKDYADKPQYKLWLAEIEALLGKEAARELFSAGKAENINRIQAIFAGVAKAFDYHGNNMTIEAQRDQMDDLNASIAPVNELLKRISALEQK